MTVQELYLELGRMMVNNQNDLELYGMDDQGGTFSVSSLYLSNYETGDAEYGPLENLNSGDLYVQVHLDY